MTGWTRTTLALLAVTSALVAASCAPPSPSPAPNTDVVIASHLTSPWSVVFLGDAALISERDSGRILELLDDHSTREVGHVDGVVHGGEGGLLGLAVLDATSLFAYSTGADGNRIQRFSIDGQPGALRLGPATTIIDGLPSAGNHNGGRIAFGPDGMLYATVGDAGDGDTAQSLESLGGKILRMRPDGSVPADNPFPGSPVYSYGHRNPQGLAWAPDGTLYASEFGQNTWDELNVIVPGGNYGWPLVEGIAEDGRFIDPVQQWAPADASPSGIAIDGGTLFIANLRGERLYAVPLQNSTLSEVLVGGLGRLRDVTITPSGQVWVLTSNTDGRGDPGEDDDLLVDVTDAVK